LRVGETARPSHEEGHRLGRAALVRSHSAHNHKTPQGRTVFLTSGAGCRATRTNVALACVIARGRARKL